MPWHRPVADRGNPVAHFFDTAVEDHPSGRIAAIEVNRPANVPLQDPCPLARHLPTLPFVAPSHAAIADSMARSRSLARLRSACVCRWQSPCTRRTADSMPARCSLPNCPCSITASLASSSLKIRRYSFTANVLVTAIVLPSPLLPLVQPDNFSIAGWQQLVNHHLTTFSESPRIGWCTYVRMVDEEVLQQWQR